MNMRKKVHAFPVWMLLGLGLVLSSCRSGKEVEAPALTQQGTVVSLTIQDPNNVPSQVVSDTLKDYRVDVYLPPGYSDTGEVYPVLYLLHGFGARADMWTGIERVQDIADYLINTGQIRPFVIVMPTAYNAFGGSWYTDCASGQVIPSGNYETYIDSTVRTYILQNYHVSDTNWVIAGHSMGGYGATRLIARHPDHYRAVASMGGVVTLLPFQADLDGNGQVDLIEQVLAENGGSMDSQDFLTLGASKVLTTFMVAMAAAWSPVVGPITAFDTTKNEWPLAEAIPGLVWVGVKLPFLNDGTLIDSIWNKWLANDPLLLAQQNLSQLQNKRFLLLAGDQDDYGLFANAQFYYDSLRSWGIPADQINLKVYPAYGIPPTDTAYVAGHSQYVYLSLKQVLRFADRVFHNEPFDLVDMP